MAEAKELKITSFDEIESTIESVKMNSSNDTITLTYQDGYIVKLTVYPSCCDLAEFIELDEYAVSDLEGLKIAKITEDDSTSLKDNMVVQDREEDHIEKHIYKIELQDHKDIFYLGAADSSNGYYDLTFSVEFT